MAFYDSVKSSVDKSDPEIVLSPKPPNKAPIYPFEKPSTLLGVRPIAIGAKNSQDHQLGKEKKE